VKFQAIKISPVVLHFTDCYRFALTEPALDGILCAPPGSDAIRELVDALTAGPLDATITSTCSIWANSCAAPPR